MNFKCVFVLLSCWDVCFCPVVLLGCMLLSCWDVCFCPVVLLGCMFLSCWDVKN